ncbi:MAG TPA: hypothetical protein ENG66_07540 [Thermococcus sp.]|nr:MAG: hypothetical protein DRP04_10660 [Archaeoglobales archaeon]HDH45215.1 hypothetical protein [Thermococcus sp.]
MAGYRVNMLWKALFGENVELKRKICCNCRNFNGFSCRMGLDVACNKVVDCLDCFGNFPCTNESYCNYFEPK